MIGRPAACLLAVGLLLLTAATAAAQPRPLVAYVPSTGDKVVIIFNANLDHNVVPAKGNFTVEVDGVVRDLTSVLITERSQLRLGLVSEVYAKQDVYADYQYVSGNRLKGADRTNVRDFTGYRVLNGATTTNPQPTTTPPPTTPPPTTPPGGTPPGGTPPGGPTQSSDASLSELLLSAGTLAFDPATTSYEVEVPHTVESLTVTPTVNHVGATVTVNGTAVESGTASGPIALSEGENAVEVDVTAADGTTERKYLVTVRRAKVLGPAEKALVDKVGQALLGRNDPGVNAPEVGSNR